MKKISYPFTNDFAQDIAIFEKHLEDIISRKDPNHKYGRAKSCLATIKSFATFYEEELKLTDNNNLFNDKFGKNSKFGKWIKEKPEHLPKYAKLLNKYSNIEYKQALENLETDIKYLRNSEDDTNNQKKCIKLLEKFFANFAERLNSDESLHNNFLHKFGVGSDFGEWIIAKHGEAKTRYLDFLANKVKDELINFDNSRYDYFKEKLIEAVTNDDRNGALDNFNMLSISLLNSLKYNIEFQKDLHREYKDVLNSIQIMYGKNTPFGHWVSEDPEALAKYKNILTGIYSNSPQTEPKQAFSVKKTTQNFFTFKAKCQEINKPSNEENETPSPPSPKK